MGTDLFELSWPVGRSQMEFIVRISLPYAVTYNTEKDVPVEVVAKSLLAHEFFIRDALQGLESIYSHHIALNHAQVTVRNISNASPLKEVLIAAFVLTVQEDLVEEVPKLIQQLTGKEVPENMETLVTLLTVVIVVYATSAIIERVMPGHSVMRLKETYSNKLDALQEDFDISKKDIDAYLQAKYNESPSSALKRKAVEFFMPAKLGKAVDIVSPNGEILVPREAVNEVPLAVLEEGDEDITGYPLFSVVLDIHRSDRDQRKYGWRAIVGEVSTKSVRLELDDSINPSSIYGSKEIVGDIIVQEHSVEDGRQEPKLYQLLRIHEVNS